MAVQSISLSGYSANTTTGGPLRLGTWDSYGIEQLQIIPGPEWEGLTITCTFVTSTSSTRMVVPASGLVDVPAEATAQALNIGNPGVIVFAGVSDGVQRISTNAYYTVANHASVEGGDPQPTPSEWQQLVAKYQEMLDAVVPPEGVTGYVLTKTDDGTAWQASQGGGGTGADGGYYTPAIEQTEPGTADFSWTASKAGMPDVPDVQLTLPPGQNGDPGENGITPTIGENGNWYLGTVDTGLPSRGPAYELTPEDKQSIVQDVLAALPNAEGVGF